MGSIKKFFPYFKYLKRVWLHFGLGIIFGIIFSLSSGLGLPLMAEIAFPILFDNSDQAPEWLRLVVEKYFSNNVTGGFLLLCSFLIPAMILVRVLSGWANGFFMNYAGIFVVQELQKDTFSKIQNLPYNFFKNNQTGEIIASVLNYPNEIRRVVVDMSNDIVKQPLTLLAAISFLIYKSFASESFFISVIGILTVPILVFPIRKIGQYLSKRSRQIVKEGESLNSLVIETIQSPVEIRAFNLEERQIGRFTDILNRIFRFTIKSIRTSLMISPSIEFVSSLGFGVALYLGVQNGMEQGEFFALFIALYMAYGPIKRLGQMHGLVRQIEAPLNRVDTILNLKEDVCYIDKDSSDINNLAIQGQIEFKDVTFAYDDGLTVLDTVNFSLKKGSPLVISGKSGAGKSSLVNLILRLYEPSSGSIILDGKEIREYNPYVLRKSIAYVPQMPLLFKGTITENIRLGNLKATDSQVIKAAKDANAYEFIQRFKDGFDTVIGEKGSTLSGGQRQRIAIARAFLKNAPVMIFDEASSALDKKNKAIFNTCLENFADKYIVIIDHDKESLPEHYSILEL